MNIITTLKIKELLFALSLLFIVLPQSVFSQCNTNTSICTPGIAGPFTFVSPGTAVSTCLDWIGPNTGYILLNITTSGNLNMLIDGNSSSGFLDVAVFNIPNGVAPCTAIQNTSNQLGCNYASASNGCNQFGTSFPCTSTVPSPSVYAGQTLMIVVENWSGSSSNFTLQLGSTPGSAQTGPPNPYINPAGPFCVTSAPYQMTAVNQGGTWSGPGISPTGIFNPATAGPGTHNISYSIGAAPCNSNFTTAVLVYSSGSLTVTPSTTICGGGSTTLTASGAATYTWSPATGLSSTTGATVTASPTTTTTYTVTGTTSGCSSTATTTVTISPPLTISVPSATICEGSSTTLTASGATNYTWSPATGLSSTTGSPVTANPTTTTTYTITGTTGACSGTTTSTVTVNPLPVVTATPITICEGGSGTITASGATSYTWSPATGLSSTSGATVTANPATTTTYTITGTTGSCSNTATVTVTVSPAPVTSVASASICQGASTTLTASGATNYTWSPATGLSATTGNSVTANPTTTTTYTITGTTGSCSSTTTATVTVNPQPTINAGPDQSVCPGGQVTLTSSGAATYTWDNGVTDGVPFTPTATTTYTVTTTANGCTGTDQVTVTVNPLPTISGGPDQAICAGQTVTLSGTGGVSYTWDNGVTNGVPFTPTANGTYTVTGTDANGCVNTDQVAVSITALPGVNAGPDQTVCTGNPVTLTGSGASTYTWDNGVTDGVAFTPTATTTYTVTGTTTNGCVNTDQVTVTVTSLPVVSAGPDVTVCAGAPVTLSGSGANTYTWDNGVTNGVAFTPTATTTYTVTGSAGAGCENTDQVTVTVNPLPTIGAGADQAVCAGTPVTLSGTGGSSYSWNNGVTNGTAFTPTATTTYTVTGTDANGCVNTDQVTITVNPLPTVGAGPDQSVCSGASVTLTGTGATSYAWDNGVTNGTAFTPTATTTYTVTGTDANGCTNTDQVTVTVITNPTIGAGPDVAICAGASVTLNGTGGSSYTWDNGVTNGLAFTPTATATYTVTGVVGTCQGTDQVTVTVNPLPTVGAGPDVALCAGQPVTLNGTGASTYTWNNSVSNGVSFVPASTATYTVTGTDANGCQNTDQVTVTVNPLPVASAGNDVSICPGTAVTLTGTGANTYTWNNGVTNAVPFNPTVSGVYVVTGTDANGCTDTDTMNLTVNPNPVVNAGPDVTVCEGNTVTLNGSGASAYTWDNGVTDGVPFTPTATATYTVTGISAAGCTATDQVVVTMSPTPVVTFQASTTFGCVPTEVVFTNTSGITTGCQWFFGDGTSGTGCNTVSHTYTSPGCFDVTLITTSANGCIGQAMVNDLVCLMENPVAEFTASPTQLSLVDSYSHMTNNSTNAVSYVWDFGDGQTSVETSPSHVFPNNGPGNYEIMLIAYNQLGCPDTAYVTVVIDEDLLYYVPNSFTPDGDQHNQTFTPVFTSGFDPYDYGLYIYNRWGELIFESHDALYGWSGTYGVGNEIAQDGVYTWKIEFKTTRTDERKIIHGHVSILK